MDRVGPFVLEAPIGQGGMATVWRASHPGQPDLPVAIKMLEPAPFADEAAVARDRSLFLDEVRAAAGLEHPCVVSILDFGIHRDAPWLAMELASGGTLREREPDLGWRELTRAIEAVLHGLAHAHARGVVHLDVKADNVLLATPADGLPGWKIADFGIAQATSTRLGNDRIAGTPSHMAPEQWAGDWRRYGPWTDLYAVGCMVWGLATGGPPFQGPPQVLMARHVFGRLPAWRATRAVPEGLEAWTRRCLARAPEDRFPSAASALAAMAELGPLVESGPGPGGATEPTASSSTFLLDDLPRPAPTPIPVPRARRVPRPGWPDWRRVTPWVPSPYRGLGLGVVGLRTPRVAGREDTCDALWRLLAEVVESGTPRVTIIRGEAGMGKSRLARWLATRAAELDVASTLWVDHHPGGEDDLAVAAALKLRTHGADDEELALTVTALVGDAPADEHALVRGLLAGTDHSVAAGARLVRALCARGPHILVLDDAQWAAPSLAVAAHLRLEPALPLLIVGVVDDTSSPDEAARAHLDALLATARVHTLEALAPAEVALAIDDLLPLAPQTAAELVQASAGVPLFAVQQLVVWATDGELSWRPEGFVHRRRAAGVPHDPGALWASRIQALLAEQAAPVWEALEVAAVLGGHIDTATWEGALGRTAPTHVVRLLARHQLAVDHPRSGTWRFASPRVRHALLGRARAAGRIAAHHAACAAALDPARDPARVGLHLLEAGRPTESIEPLQAGILAARVDGDFATLARLLPQLGRAADEAALSTDHPVRLRAETERVRLMHHMRGPQVALPLARAAYDQAMASGDPGLAALAAPALAMVLRGQEDFAGAQAVVEQVLHRHAGRLSQAECAILEASIGASLAYLGDRVAARIRLQRALDMGELSASQRGDVHRYLANTCPDHAAHRHQLRLAHDAYAAGGSPMGRAACLVSMGNLDLIDGLYDDAATALWEAARLMTLHGSPQAAVPLVLASRAEAHREAWVPARRAAEQAQARARAHGMADLEPVAVALLMVCDAAEGHWLAWEDRTALCRTVLDGPDARHLSLLALFAEMAATQIARTGDPARSPAAHALVDRLRAMLPSGRSA